MSDPQFSSTDLQQAHTNAILLSRLIINADPVQLQAVLDEMSRMEALMPMLDPTGYRSVMNNIPRHRRVIGAILGAHKEIAAVLDEEQRRP